MGRPQTVRRGLNGTATNNVDFVITVKEGICGDEHMASLTANVHLSEKDMAGQLRMGGGDDGGCKQRTTNDLVKFRAHTQNSY